MINVISSGTNGIKANDYICIKGGALNVEVSSSGGKCLSSDGYVRVDGGRSVLMTLGGVDESDYSSAACVKSDSIFIMNDGILHCKSTGQGGKGIKADMNAYFNGGSVRVITEGSDYGSSGGGPWGGSSSSENTARPKGIRVEGKLFLNGGDILVRTASHEGVESKSYIEINGGRLLVHSYDDAINSAGDLVINSGHIYAQATANDALDSNGNMTINEGMIFAVGPASGIECAIDVNTESRAVLNVNGGTLLALGGYTVPAGGGQSYASYGSAGMGGGFGGGKPGSGQSSGSMASDRIYGLYDMGNTLVMAFCPSVSFSRMLVSSPTLADVNTCTLMSGVTAKGGNDFCGLLTGAEVTGGTSVATLNVTKP